MRRLQRNAPELHAEVLAGRLTAHAAMVRAGFTAPRFTVHVTSPEAVAKTIRSKVPADMWPAVMAQLTEEAP